MNLMELALRFTQASAHVLWAGALLALAVFVIERLFVRTAAGRHALHLAGLILLALSLPVAFALTPATPHRPVPFSTTDASGLAMSSAPLGGESSPAVEVPVPRAIGMRSGSAIPEADFAPSPVPKLASSTPVDWERIAPWAAGTYLLGLIAMLVRMSCGFAGTARLRRQSEPVEAGIWTAALQRMGDQIRLRTRPALKWSREVAAPVIVGFVKPAILLPVALASRLSPAQVEAVLAHELAHLQRRDTWVLAAQRLVETVLFFHPAVWWMSCRMDVAREEACDDLVLAAGCNPADYAEALVICSECRLEGAATSPRLATGLSAAGNSRNHLRRRVLRLIGSGDDGAIRLGRTGWVLGLLLVGGVVVALAAGGVRRVEDADSESDLNQNLKLVKALEQQGATIHAAVRDRNGQRYLKGLDVFYASEGALSTLGELRGLEELRFTACDLRTPAFSEVGKLNSLKKLMVITGKFMPAQLAAISNLTHLEHLVLMFTVLDETKEGRVRLLGALTSDEARSQQTLKNAGIGEHVIEAALLTDRAMVHLTNLTALKTLSLLNTFVTPRSLSGLRGLEQLDAGIVGLTPDQAGIWKQMPKLKSLRYFNSDDAQVAGISQLTNLETLEIWSGEVTDSGAAQLLKLQRLQQLAIRGNKMTDDGLMKLAGLPRLETLDVQYAPALTAEGIARFRVLRQGVTVRSSEPSSANTNQLANPPEIIWGEPLDGLRCRWVAVPGEVTVGTVPMVSIEVENATNQPIFWACESQITWGFKESPLSHIMPKFTVQAGTGTRPATAREVRDAFGVSRPGLKDNDAMGGPEGGYFHLAPGGRMILTARLPLPLSQPGSISIECRLARHNPRSNRDIPNNWFACPPLVMNVRLADFDRLEIEIGATIWAGKAKLEIKPDGSGTFGTGTWAGEGGRVGAWREIKLQLTPEQLNALRAALDQCQWLKAEPVEGPPPTDSPIYTIQLQQNGQTRQVTATGHKPDAYAPLMAWAGSIAREARERKAEAAIQSTTQTDAPWGDPTDGVQVRLHSPRQAWSKDEFSIYFSTDLRSATEHVFPHYGPMNAEFFLELDGHWYEVNNPQVSFASVGPSPATLRENLHTWITARHWRSMSTGKPMPDFASGRHTFRIGFPLSDKPDASGQRPRAVSNPVEIEVIPRDDGVSITGQVIGVRGKPADVYRVTALPGKWSTSWGEMPVVMTGTDGTFTFRGLPDGPCDVSATPVPQTDQPNMRIEGVVLKKGEPVNVTLLLEEKYSFSGRLTDAAGKPQTNRNVLAIWKDPASQATYSSSTKTDAEGRYRFKSPFEVAERILINDGNFSDRVGHQNVQSGREDVDFQLPAGRAAATPPAGQMGGFGDTIQRPIGPDFNSGIDMDAGLVRTMDRGFQPQEDRLAALGADLWVSPIDSPPMPVHGLNLAAVRAADNDWSITPAELARRLDGVAPKATTLLWDEKARYPATFLVRTREGGMGVLQILGSDTNIPSGWKVRYKMLLKPTAADAAGASRPLTPPNGVREVVITLDAQRLLAMSLQLSDIVAALHQKGIQDAIGKSEMDILRTMSVSRSGGATLRPSDVARIEERRTDTLSIAGGMGPLTRVAADGSHEILLMVVDGPTLASVSPAQSEVPTTGPKTSGESDAQTEAAWGEPVNGLSVRLRPGRRLISGEQRAEFQLDTRNSGSNAVPLGRMFEGCFLEVDGQWYGAGVTMTGDLLPPAILKPGETHFALETLKLVAGTNLSVPGLIWHGSFPSPRPLPAAAQTNIHVLNLTPGKHIIRLAYNPTPNKVSYDQLAYSNPVELEITPAGAGGQDEAVSLHPDLERIKGEWEIVSVEGNGPFQWQIQKRGDRIHIEKVSLRNFDSTDRSLLSSYYIISPQKTPKELDVTFWMDNQFVPQLQHGLYQLDGDKLIFCMAAYPDERPQQFAAVPGKSTLFVLKRITGTGTNSASSRVENSVGGRAEALWSQPISGLQCRLRADQPSWTEGQTPTFRAAIRNQGTGTYTVAQAQELCELELDGQRYRWAGDIDVKSSQLVPGREFGNISISLTGDWAKVEAGPAGRRVFTSDKLQLLPGLHTLRILFYCDGGSSQENFDLASDELGFEIGRKNQDHSNASPPGTPPDLDFSGGVWNLPLSQFVPRPTLKTITVVDFAFPDILTKLPWEDTTKDGREVVEAAGKGHLFVPEPDVVVPVNGVLMVPLAAPLGPTEGRPSLLPSMTGRKLREIFGNQSLEEIVGSIKAWNEEKRVPTRFVLLGGAFYVAAAPDGRVVAMYAQGKPGEVWVQFIPIGTIKNTGTVAAPQDKTGAPAEEETAWSRPVNGLQCRLLPASQTAVPSTGGRQDTSVYVTYELRNVSGKAVKFLPWYSPLESVSSGSVFQVVDQEGKTPAYRGKEADRMPPTANSFITLEPGQTLTNRVGLPYDFSRPGSYRITSTKSDTGTSAMEFYYGNDAAKISANPDNVWTGKLESNEVEVTIVAARELRNERSGQAPAAAADARQRLIQSVAIIQGVYENTRAAGRGLRSQVWEVGEALPWRSTLQPSCLRQRGFELRQLPEPWPVASDAPALRSLLADPVPAVRALAAEALATLQQPEDLSRLTALLTDSAEATMELQAPPVPQQLFSPVDLVRAGPDSVASHTWHKSIVGQHAAWGLNVMLGDCCPQTIVDMQFTRFGTYGLELSSSLPRIDPSILASLAAGDPKDHLWYWQEYIHRSLHQLDGGADARTAKREWMKSFFAEMRTWPAERRAMVRLLATDIHQGGADMAYYDTPGQLLFSGPLDLGLPKSRVLELLDAVKLWPNERRDRGGPNQVVERLAMGWSECFDSADVPQLLARFTNAHDDLWWSGRAALLVALAHLMPTTGTASDDPANAEGFLRQTLKQDNEVFIRSRAASELMRMGLDVHWPLLSERFFEDRANGDTVPTGMIEWLEKAAHGNGPTRRLVELVVDERFRPFWLEPEKPAGKAMRGGGLRYQAASALNIRAGRTVVTDEDLAALSDPGQGPARLQLVLARVREIGKENLLAEVIPLKRSVRLGDPIVVSLRVTNQTSKAAKTLQSATAFDCFEVIGPDGKRLPYVGFDGQAPAYPVDVPPFSSATLAEALDLRAKYLFQKPGRYSVRFSERFSGLADSPSTTIEITPGTLSKFDEVVASLLPVCPDGWRLVKGGGGVIQPRAPGFDLHLCHNHMRGEAVWLWFTTGQTPGEGAEYWGRVGELSVYGSVGTNTRALWPTAVQDISRALELRLATPPKSSQSRGGAAPAAMADGDSATNSTEKDIQVVSTPANHFAIYQVLGHTNAPHFRSTDRARIIFSDTGTGANRFDSLKPENYPLEGLILAEQPLLTEADLVAYDRQKNQMQLKPGVIGRFPKPSVWGVPFVVVADGQRLFLGAFWTGDSSYSANMPTIPLERWGAGLPADDPDYLPPDTVRLENRQRRREGELPSDPRQDERLYRALEAAGKLMPTSATLDQWLEGKEVVEVCFAGPKMDQAKLQELLAGRGSNDVMVDPSYILLSGVEGVVRVQMQATPGNVKRLLSLQEELAKHGFTLDGKATQMWSYAGDAGLRRKARELVPQVMAAAAAAIQKAVPQARTSSERESPVSYVAGVSYEVPGTQIRGMFRINEIRPHKSWRLSAAPNLTAHLPHLGLMVSLYHRPGQVGGMDEVTPEHLAVLDAVRQAIQPLVQLEESPILRAWPEVEVRQSKIDGVKQGVEAVEASSPGRGTSNLKAILPILESLKAEVAALTNQFPGLAAAAAVPVKADGWLFEHDCRDMGKRGYEDTGSFPVAIGLKVMTTKDYREQVGKVEMSHPSDEWDYLGLVGWTALHVGGAGEVAPGLVGKFQEALKNAVIRIGPLNRQALAASLPQAVQTQRDRLLAEADAKIRNGIRQLADTYPQLKKGQTWERLSIASDPGRIGIYHVQQPGKTAPDPAVFPPAEKFNVLVVVELPPDEIGQMETSALYPRLLYPRLGLVGQANTSAADPALDAALKKLVNDALAPLAELEARAMMQSSGTPPSSVNVNSALASSDSRERFLAVERFARLPQAEQATRLPDFYTQLPPRSLSMFVEGILSSAPHDILHRTTAVYDGNTRLWAQQLADAASTLTPEQIATNLAGQTWMNVATRARALWLFEQHPSITSNLLAADLSSRDTNAIDRAATVILALELKTFTPRLLEIWLANDERSQPFALWNALLFLRDPSIVRPLLDRVEKDPKVLVRCAGIFQGTLYNQPVEPVLFKLLNSPDPEIRYSAAYALEECTDSRLAQPAARLVKEPDSRSRFVAAHMVARLPEEAFQSVRTNLLPLLSDKEEEVRYYALLSFGKRKDPAAGPVILDALKNEKLAEQYKVWVIQAMSALSGSTWNYYSHEWGPARPGNQTAIEKFEAWLKEHSPK